MTQAEEFYLLCVCVCMCVCLIMCDLEASTVGRHRPKLACHATGQKILMLPLKTRYTNENLEFMTSI